MTINVLRSSCKVPVNLVKIFLDRFSKNIQISNFVKILPMEAQLFHADGRTDRGTDKRDETMS